MGVRFVARLIDSLSYPPQADVTSSWITDDPGWVEYFGLTISAHHGAVVEPLALVPFEAAFRNSCEAVGWRVEKVGSATQRFVDITVRADGGAARRLSLKSTAARRLSATTAHISKLTEAAWIQDVRSARVRRERTLELFQQYRAAVDSIVIAESFSQAGRGAERVPTLGDPNGDLCLPGRGSSVGIRGGRSDHGLRFPGRTGGRAGFFGPIGRKNHGQADQTLVLPPPR